MRIVYLEGHLNVLEIWFERNVDINEIINESPIKVDKVYTYGNEKSVMGYHSSKFISLLTDLTVSEESLWTKLSKTTRQEINRAKREDIRLLEIKNHEFYRNKEILKRFGDTYTHMYAQKGMNGIYLPMERISAYIENKCFIITSAMIDGQEAVYHSYIYDNHETRLLQSCSAFRGEDRTIKSKVSWANRYLHWNDMLMFKNAGLKRYDWGGV